MTGTLPQAVLFDLDGTLVDTEPYWAIAERSLVESYGGSWSIEDGLSLIGAGLLTTAAKIQSRGVNLSPNEIVDHLTNSVLAQTETQIPWRPGALELLLEIRSNSVPTGLVTMSMPPMANFIANSMGTSIFDVVVTGDQVSLPKPDPAAYLLAAERLGVNPKDCIAIEDSIPGVVSAKSSGAFVIGVPAHVDLTGAPDLRIWPTLENRTFEQLRSEIEARRSVEAKG